MTDETNDPGLFQVTPEDMTTLYQDGVGYFDYPSFCNLFARPLTLPEFTYLLQRYPYLDIAQTPEAVLNPESVQRSTTQTGWLLCDGGERIVTGAGRLAFGRYNLQAGDEDEDGGGSLYQQGIDTVAEILALASARWDTVHIHDGTYALQRTAWITGLDQGLTVSGFAPTDEDQMRRDRIIFLRDNTAESLLQRSKGFGF